MGPVSDKLIYKVKNHIRLQKFWKVLKNLLKKLVNYTSETFYPKNDCSYRWYYCYMAIFTIITISNMAPASLLKAIIIIFYKIYDKNTQSLIGINTRYFVPILGWIFFVVYLCVIKV